LETKFQFIIYKNNGEKRREGKKKKVQTTAPRPLRRGPARLPYDGKRKKPKKKARRLRMGG
jgi:hypothetical protein